MIKQFRKNILLWAIDKILHMWILMNSKYEFNKNLEYNCIKNPIEDSR